MSNFDQAINVILEHEGYDKFTNDPADPGGATKWGISLRFVRTELNIDTDGDGYKDGDLDRDGDLDLDDIRNINKEQAVSIYRRQFWDRMQIDKIPDQRVATKVFDAGVNMGRVWGIVLLQRSFRAVGWPLIDDGRLGPQTEQVIAASETNGLWGVTLIAYRSEMAGRYRELMSKNPVLEKYRRGWLRRAYDDQI